MDAALGLSLWYTLHPVDPAFKLEPMVNAPAIDLQNGFPHAAQLCLAEGQGFHLPAASLRIHGVHTHKAVGKQGGFFSACAAAHLQDHAFLSF